LWENRSILESDDTTLVKGAAGCDQPPIANSTFSLGFVNLSFITLEYVSEI
jgi:hypothetical protein